METKTLSVSLSKELHQWFTEYVAYCEYSQDYMIQEMIKHLRRSVSED